LVEEAQLLNVEGVGIDGIDRAADDVGEQQFSGSDVAALSLDEELAHEGADFVGADGLAGCPADGGHVAAEGIAGAAGVAFDEAAALVAVLGAAARPQDAAFRFAVGFVGRRRVGGKYGAWRER
jgi:hypothetical protein